MADPFPPPEARERRIGAWVSGVAHAALIGWVALGGWAFRSQQQAPALRMSPVETMSAAQFERMAAASRGAGPVGEVVSATPAQPRPPSDEVIAGGPVALSPPVLNPDPAAMPAPDVAGEAAPNLSDVQTPQSPVAVATVAPSPQQPSAADDLALPPAPVAADLPASAAAPALPAPAPAALAPVAPAPAPALTTSDAPFQVAAARQRLAERQAEAQAEAQRQAAAAAEAARQADAQRQADAEAARQAAADQARAAAEAAARAEADRAAAEAAAEAERAQAEARARAEAEAAAEAERQAAREAEQQRQAEAAAEAAAEAERQAQAERQRQAEAEAEARRVEEERQAEAQRQAEAERRRAEEEAAAASAAAALARAAEAERARAEAEAREQAEAARQAPDEPDALMQALAQAMDQPPEGAGSEGGGGRAAEGPPLSRGEKDGLRLQIEACWNIGSLSREAQRTSVTVAFNLTPDGMPEADSVRLLGSEGGSDAAAAQAFEAARRAILRCALQREGYQLPPEKYARWRETIIDFRPQGGPSIR